MSDRARDIYPHIERIWNTPDEFIVQEKFDGSNFLVAKLEDGFHYFSKRQEITWGDKLFSFIWENNNKDDLEKYVSESIAKNDGNAIVFEAIGQANLKYNNTHAGKLLYLDNCWIRQDEKFTIIPNPLYNSLKTKISYLESGIVKRKQLHRPFEDTEETLVKLKEEFSNTKEQIEIRKWSVKKTLMVDWNNIVKNDKYQTTEIGQIKFKSLVEAIGYMMQNLFKKSVIDNATQIEGFVVKNKSLRLIYKWYVRKSGKSMTEDILNRLKELNISVNTEKDQLDQMVWKEFTNEEE